MKDNSIEGTTSTDDKKRIKELEAELVKKKQRSSF